MDGRLPIADMRSLDLQVENSLSPSRLAAAMAGLFAALALFLAAAGIYGLLAYAVSARTHEIGIRTALGATHRDVVRVIVTEAMVPTFGGLVIGTIGSLMVTRLLSTILFGVAPTDPSIFVVVSVILGSVVLLASYIPARRATRVDPMVALRYE